MANTNIIGLPIPITTWFFSSLNSSICVLRFLMMLVIGVQLCSDSISFILTFGAVACLCSTSLLLFEKLMTSFNTVFPVFLRVMVSNSSFQILHSFIVLIMFVPLIVSFPFSSPQS